MALEHFLVTCFTGKCHRSFRLEYKWIFNGFRMRQTLERGEGEAGRENAMVLGIKHREGLMQALFPELPVSMHACILKDGLKFLFILTYI